MCPQSSSDKLEGRQTPALTPALSPRRGRNARRLNREPADEFNMSLSKNQAAHYCRSLSPGERVGVRASVPQTLSKSAIVNRKS